jgi:hypothetical protein
MAAAVVFAVIALGGCGGSPEGRATAPAGEAVDAGATASARETTGVAASGAGEKGSGADQAKSKAVVPDRDSPLRITGAKSDTETLHDDIGARAEDIRRQAGSGG